MKQPCASAAKLKGAGPFRRRHHSHGSGRDTVAPEPAEGDRYRQLALSVRPCAETLYLSFSSIVRLINRLGGVNDVDQASDGRGTMPCGISPVVTSLIFAPGSTTASPSRRVLAEIYRAKRHNPMSSLRASATTP